MSEESDLKLLCKRHVEKTYSGHLVSVSSKSILGYPDSDLLIPDRPVVKVEFKAQDESLTPAQMRWRKWFLDHGFIHWVIDNYLDFEYACSAYEEYGEGPCKQNLISFPNRRRRPSGSPRERKR